MRARYLPLAAGAALLATACGSNGGDLFSSGKPDAASLSGPNNGDGGFNLAEAGTFDLDALAAADPPNQWCGPDGGGPPPPPPVGGTPDCPTDKNLQSCPCPTPGATAACWPGLRKNRNVGACKDGTTTCTPFGEVGNQWGPCVGAVLPDPTATSGPAACGCFSQGQWHIENLVPFFVTYSDGTTYSISTTQDPDGGTTVFPPIPTVEPPPAQTADWSKDDLTVDCAGTFTLCYDIKAGDFNHPLPSDPSILQAPLCLPATFYSTANVAQAFPTFKPWEGDAAHSAAAANFHANGGYGEMSVLGESVLCQHIDDGTGKSFVFHRLKYCPPSTPSCGQDGSGVFK